VDLANLAGARLSLRCLARVNWDPGVGCLFFRVKLGNVGKTTNFNMIYRISTE